MHLEYHRLFRKKFARLSPKLQQVFRARLEIFINDKFDPILNNHSLSGKYSGCRSINVTGDYRAVFVELAEQVKFFDIGTHHEFYGT